MGFLPPSLLVEVRHYLGPKCRNPWWWCSVNDITWCEITMAFPSSDSWHLSSSPSMHDYTELPACAIATVVGIETNPAAGSHECPSGQKCESHIGFVDTRTAAAAIVYMSDSVFIIWCHFKKKYSLNNPINMIKLFTNVGDDNGLPCNLLCWRHQDSAYLTGH